MSAHALLSASSAHRWLACTPSAQLETQFPDSTSDYAREGTLAHEICELKVGQKYLGQKNSKKLSECKKKELYNSEMEGYTNDYLDFISKVYMSFEEEPYIDVEKRLDFSVYVPEGYGTGDCIIIGGHTLHVIDFKYGKGVAVYPEGNPQLMLYALGAYETYKMLYPIHRINISIVQPRIGNTDTAGIDIEDLLKWAEEEVIPKALLASKGEGDYVSGGHCRFCRAKARCRARAVFNMAIEPTTAVEPSLLSTDEIGDYLTRSADVVAWASDLKEYALSQCLSGEAIPGWKAVEGRSNRTWTDQEEAFQAIIDQGLAKKTKLYEKKPITLTAVEKLIGKNEFVAAVGDFVTKPPGKPTLATEADKRPSITLKTTAEEAFGEMEK